MNRCVAVAMDNMGSVDAMHVFAVSINEPDVILRVHLVWSRR